MDFLSDWTGRRKPFMTGGLLVFALCFFALAHIDPGDHFLVFALVLWTASLALAWFDTCADGWAVDSSEQHEQSHIQAAMTSGKSLGLVTMSITFGFSGDAPRFLNHFQSDRCIGAVVLVVVWLTEPPKQHRKSDGLVEGWRSLLKSHYVFFALYACVYAVASMGTDGLVTLHLSQTREAGSLDIGFFGMARGMGAFVGAISFALIRPRIGVKPAQYLALLLLALGCLVPLVEPALLTYAGAWGFCWGFQETAFVTLPCGTRKGVGRRLSLRAR